MFSGKDWWDVHGAQKGLHAMNAIRIPLVKSALTASEDGTPKSAAAGQPALHGYSILDVGCGGGILSEVRKKQSISTARTGRPFVR